MIQRFEEHLPDIHPEAFVHPMAYVSGQVSIARDASIWPMTIVRGDINSISIGAGSNIQDGSVLHVTHASRFSRSEGEALRIGSDVTVGHNVTLHGCTLHDRCLIGMGAIVLDGAEVEANTMVGAGSLVPPQKVLESGFLYVGSPVKRVRGLTEQELEYLAYSARHYVQLARRTAVSCS